MTWQSAVFNLESRLQASYFSTFSPWKQLHRYVHSSEVKFHFLLHIWLPLHQEWSLQLFRPSPTCRSRKQLSGNSPRCKWTKQHQQSRNYARAQTIQHLSNARSKGHRPWSSSMSIKRVQLSELSRQLCSNLECDPPSWLFKRICRRQLTS